jgi:hypothetical protein
MYSRTLLRLIDETIVPTVVVIFAKLLGMVVFANHFGVDWQIESFQFTFQSLGDYILLNSYSNLFMFGVFSIGLAWICLRSVVLHESHIHPGLFVKLINRNLVNLLASSLKIYHQAFIWWVYALFLTVLFIIQAYYGLLFPWIALVSLLITLVFSWIIFLDIEKEYDLSGKIMTTKLRDR